MLGALSGDASRIPVPGARPDLTRQIDGIGGGIAPPPCEEEPFVPPAIHVTLASHHLSRGRRL